MSGNPRIVNNTEYTIQYYIFQEKLFGFKHHIEAGGGFGILNQEANARVAIDQTLHAATTPTQNGLITSGTSEIIRIEARTCYLTYYVHLSYGPLLVEENIQLNKGSMISPGTVFNISEAKITAVYKMDQEQQRQLTEVTTQTTTSTKLESTTPAPRNLLGPQMFVLLVCLALLFIVIVVVVIETTR